MQVLQSARKLFASRYGKTRTSMSRGRSMIELSLSAIALPCLFVVVVQEIEAHFARSDDRC